MPTFTHARPIAVALLALTVLGAPAPVAAQATPAAEGTPAAGAFTLPGENVFPEGIALDETSGDFYVGSTTDGTIYRGNVDGPGELEVFSEGGADGRTQVTGMKVDAEGRLFIAGRFTGQFFVYDTADGALLARFANGLGEDETIVNDVAIDAAGNAYVTDSFNPVVYRIEAGSVGGAAVTAADDVAELPVWLELEGTPFAYGEGFNANGIVVTDDGRYLLIVQFNTGQLFRIDTETREVAEVDLGGASLTGGDGMALDGQTLYVVRDEEALIASVAMADDFAAGTVGEELADPTFDYPTTMALLGDGTALVVNSQLDMAGGGGAPDLPFTVVTVTLPAAATS